MHIRVGELGREHPFTLKFKLTLTKIKTAMNLFEEAEGVSLEGLPAAERNSGEHHLGTLTARTWLAHLYWRQGRYSDAEAIWEDIIQKRNYEQSKRTDGELTDRSRWDVHVHSLFYLLYPIQIGYYFVQETQLRRNYTF